MERLTLTKEQRETEGVGYVKYLKPEILQEWDKKLSAYEDAEDEGRIVVLPCKVGDTVNWSNYFNSDSGLVAKREFEKVFLTSEAAEQAIKESENNG